jgi:hypothetical protein
MAKGYFLLFVACWQIQYAQADIETDKVAGECAAYLSALKRDKAAALALEMADNQRRALQFAHAWLRSTKGKSKSSIQYLAIRADGDCRKVGIRPADYSN